MIHTYRDMNAPGARSIAVQTAAAAVLIPVGWIAFFVYAGAGFELVWENVLILAAGVVLPPVFMFLAYWDASRALCREIRLDDDGTCELVTSHRVIRLHVNEITALKYQRDSEGDTGSFSIRYTGGKLEVRGR